MCRHKRVGLVSNQQIPPFDDQRALHMAACCDRPDCIAKAIRACNRFTKEKDTATFLSDTDRIEAAKVATAKVIEDAKQVQAKMAEAVEVLTSLRSRTSRNRKEAGT